MTLGKITAINQDGFKSDTGRWPTSFEGISVVTEETTAYAGISDDQSCCEEAGYFTSNDLSDDGVAEYIGAELIEVAVVGDKLETTVVDLEQYGSATFINFVTSKGTFQLTVYNEHNGYYSHEVVVRVGDKVQTSFSL